MSPDEIQTDRKMKAMHRSTFLVATVCAAILAPTARGEGPEKPPAAGQPATKPAGAGTATKLPRLCDQDWRYGFWTVAIDSVDYDGKSQVKDYAPDKPEDPWSTLSDRYLGLHDRAGRHFLYRFIGQFYDKKEAEAFLTKVHQEAKFARHLNPRFPPMVLSLGALLVSDHYTCKLDHNNSELTNADWVAEVDGNLYAAQTKPCCKGGKLRSRTVMGADGDFKVGVEPCGKDKRTKTIAVSDCTGTKTLFTDALSSPCEDASPTNACIYPMSPGFVAIEQEYSAGGDEVTSSIRVWDVASKKAVVKIKAGGALTADGGSFRELKDQDGDGIPEVVDRDCVEGKGCTIKRLQKWNGTRFVDAKAK
jgi:hypothetical protein